MVLLTIGIIIGSIIAYVIGAAITINITDALSMGGVEEYEYTPFIIFWYIILPLVLLYGLFNLIVGD